MIKSLPKTCEDLLKLDTKDLSFSASWSDYLLLQGSTEFRMEFDDNIIYPKFCFESDNHSAIARNIGFEFIHKFTGNSNFKASTTNHMVYIKNYQKIYLPDNYIILGEANSHTVKKEFAPYTNPWMIAEVTTQKNVVKNWSKKLPSYKKIPSMRYILFIDEERPYVSLFIRNKKSSIWENTDYDNLKDAIKIEGVSIPLKNIYNKISFIKKVDS